MASTGIPADAAQAHQTHQLEETIFPVLRVATVPQGSRRVGEDCGPRLGDVLAFAVGLAIFSAFASSATVLATIAMGAEPGPLTLVAATSMVVGAILISRFVGRGSSARGVELVLAVVGVFAAFFYFVLLNHSG